MSVHRLEVYLDSYNSEPILHESDRPISINIGDEISRADWLEILSRKTNGSQLPVIELKVKVEDVRHLFWDAEDIVHSVNVRVVPV